MFTLNIDKIIELTPVVILAVLSYLMFITGLIIATCYKYNTQPSTVSSKTKSQQRTLIKVVIFQTLNMLITVLIPVAIVVINANSYYLDVYFSFAMLTSSTYSTIDTIMITITIKPYREFVLKFFSRRKNTETKVVVKPKTFRKTVDPINNISFDKKLIRISSQDK